jgi:hypothetical protein
VSECTLEGFCSGVFGCSENFYKFENILPGMRRKVNISTLMVFRNQRRRRKYCDANCHFISMFENHLNHANHCNKLMMIFLSFGAS